MPKRTETTLRRRIEIVEYILKLKADGTKGALASTCRIAGLTEGAVNRWIKDFKEGLYENLTSKQLDGCTRPATKTVKKQVPDPCQLEIPEDMPADVRELNARHASQAQILELSLTGLQNMLGKTNEHLCNMINTQQETNQILLNYVEPVDAILAVLGGINSSMNPEPLLEMLGGIKVKIEGVKRGLALLMNPTGDLTDDERTYIKAIDDVKNDG